MSIVFNHAVKYNGKYYPPNTPIEDEKPVKPAESAGTGSETNDTQTAEKASQKPAQGRRKASAKNGDAK